MGCDIHEMTEVRIDGTWRVADVETNIPRNYNLFAMLADVRNGRGFAGVKTGDGFVPILRALYAREPQRGVPDDASPEYKANVAEWDADGHSHSWVTLAELKAYNWRGQSTKLCGCVGVTAYKRWRESKTNGPREWSGDVFGARVKIVSCEEMDRIIAEGREGEADYYARAEWGVSYASAAGRFLTETMPALESYARERGIADEDLRLVFFFDN